MILTKILSNSPKIYLDSNGNISVKGPEGSSDVSVLGLSSDDRPIYCSELFKRLNNRRWNLPFRRVIMDGKIGVLKQDLLPTLDMDDSINFEKQIYKREGSAVCSTFPRVFEDENNETKAINDIMAKYNMLVDSGRNVTLYSSSKLVIDILKHCVTFNMLSPDSYTNVVSLVGLEKKALPGRDTTGVVTIGISYSKNDEVCSDSLTFTAFKASAVEGNAGEVAVETIDFAKPLHDVMVEFIDGVIRVFPVSPGVGECIISDCSVTYGNI